MCAKYPTVQKDNMQTQLRLRSFDGEGGGGAYKYFCLAPLPPTTHSVHRYAHGTSIPYLAFYRHLVIALTLVISIRLN